MATMIAPGTHHESYEDQEDKSDIDAGSPRRRSHSPSPDSLSSEPPLKIACEENPIYPLSQPHHVFRILLGVHFKTPIIKPRMLLALHWLHGSDNERQIIWKQYHLSYKLFLRTAKWGKCLGFSYNPEFTCSRQHAKQEYRLDNDDLLPLDSFARRFRISDVRQMSMWKHSYDEYREFRQKREQFRLRKLELREQRFKYMKNYLSATFSFDNEQWLNYFTETVAFDFMNNGLRKTEFKATLGHCMHLLERTQDQEVCVQELLIEKLGKIPQFVSDEILVVEVRRAIWTVKFEHLGVYKLATIKDDFIQGRKTAEEVQEFINAEEERIQADREEKERMRVQREVLLVAALADLGLDLPKDNVYCLDYIEKGEQDDLSLQEVVNEVRDDNWLTHNTLYPQIKESVRRQSVQAVFPSLRYQRHLHPLLRRPECVDIICAKSALQLYLAEFSDVEIPFGLMSKYNVSYSDDMMI
ncbi:hypothetical protein GEMRC1_003903 [Eukaryota sp. GEM-RC1]